jgi:putative iron-only hydrogenase system regulator
MNIYPLHLQSNPAKRPWLTLGKTRNELLINSSLKSTFPFHWFPADNFCKMKRLGFVGIIIENRIKSSGIVNDILSQFAELILVRTGLPNAKGDTSVITLVIDASSDELGVLTGKLGNIIPKTYQNER